MIEEKFVKTVEQTANAAISVGRDVNDVIHDTIEVLYGRKNINELLPKGWIIANDCSECKYEDTPGGSEPCYRCYNKFFGASNLYNLDLGPYTNNFTPRDEQKNTDNDPLRECMDCAYDTLRVDDISPCYNCFDKSEKPNFTPKEVK